MVKIWISFLRIFLVAVFVCISNTAHADVEVSFYSHDFGNRFPHTFFTTRGKLANGKIVDASYGFTAVRISPAIMMKSVKGVVKPLSRSYIEHSALQITISIDDEQYRSLMDIVGAWQSVSGKNYNLNKRNCVHFVSDVLVGLGYKVNAKSRNFKKPKSYLQEIKTLNPELKNSSSETQVAGVPKK